MFLFRRKIDRVENISTDGNNFLVALKDNKIIFNESKINITSSIKGAYLNKNGIIRLSTDGEKKYYDNYFNFLPISASLRTFLGMKLNEKYEFIINTNNNYGLFDIEKKEIEQIFKAKFNGLYPSAFTKEYLFIHKFPEPIIQSLSLLTGLYEWELDLGIQGLEVGSILGIYEDNLIILCNKLVILYNIEARTNILLALDVHTGKVVWVKDMGFAKDRFIMNVDNSTIINLFSRGFRQNNKNIGDNIFREINTKDGSVKREGMLRDLDEVGLRISAYTLYKDKIYFTADYQGSFSGVTIGVLDYETLSLLWWEEVKMEEANGFGNFLTQIQASENRIYALDKTGTLHIYQRDENVPFVKPTESGLVPFEDLPIKPEIEEKNTDEQDFSGLPF